MGWELAVFLARRFNRVKCEETDRMKMLSRPRPMRDILLVPLAASLFCTGCSKEADGPVSQQAASVAEVGLTPELKMKMDSQRALIAAAIEKHAGIRALTRSR